MKKIIILLVICAVILPSCSDTYLDKAPEAGLTEAQVFSSYDNFKKYFESVYKGTDNNVRLGFSFYFATWDQKHGWDALTDEADQARLLCHGIKGGNLGGKLDYFSTQGGARRPILYGMLKVIRVCNKSLENMDKVKDAAKEDMDDYRAQAYFVRAFAHFTLVKLWGGMPYLDKSLGEDDQWDLPRLSANETLKRCAMDLDTAVEYFKKAGKMRRDNPMVGAPGHLDNPDLFKPNGVTALALKSRVLLYAASPLSNKNGVSDWKAAAEASWAAIKAAEDNGYFLLPFEQYKDNFIDKYYSDEQLWADSWGPMGYNNALLKFINNGVFANVKSDFSGDCPTQNLVDRFETKEGDPLYTETERQAAIAAGHYNDQDPYTNRDPRFYIDIIYNTAPIPGYVTAKIYVDNSSGKPVYSELFDQSYAGITHTGYYIRKIWGEHSVKNKTNPLYTDPVIRLGELYLNYAEAANEAYGPTGTPPGASMNAVQAINKIRHRVNMPDVQARFTVSTETFRPRIKNERIIELCFEGHQYFDLRRWKDAPVAYSGKLYAMNAEKVKVTSEYPTGYKYTRIALPENRQTAWKDAMYYFPFPNADMNKMKNFTPNEVW